ncbi:hypothetical protein [Sporosarcina sp. 6E9]|uniref:hypothetical protein n=1 Tax=Sporosarcina sp. 6E9 TaxID=2819235 RepID=UPI001AC26167|nr:hypothetical protein [Sporosarcina sp. 6E9]MBO1910155.1 hypothetical protein [Microvirga sp. 3-52]
MNYQPLNYDEAWRNFVFLDDIRIKYERKTGELLRNKTFECDVMLMKKNKGNFGLSNMDVNFVRNTNYSNSRAKCDWYSIGTDWDEYIPRSQPYKKLLYKSYDTDYCKITLDEGVLKIYATNGIIICISFPNQLLEYVIDTI